MGGRVIEDEAGGLVLVEQRVAVFRQKLLFLVGTEKPGVLVGADQIVIAGQKAGTVGQALDRLVLPQCTISRVAVGIELRGQFLDVETCRHLSRVRIHAPILFGGDRYAVFALPETAAPSTVPRIQSRLAHWK